MKVLNAGIIKTYNFIISRRIINKNNRISRKIRSVLLHNICYECDARFGHKNKERRFYLIRCPQDDMGLFAVINYVVWHLKRAEELKREPVVDWQYYPNKYFTEDESAGKVNVWESMFEQTTDVELSEIYNSFDVVMSSGDWEPNAMAEARDFDMLKSSHRIYEKYIHLNEQMIKYLNSEKRRIGIGVKRVLGVKVRGTDFITTSPSDHAKVSSVEETVNMIYEKEETWGPYECIYLATEDDDVLKGMIAEFGDKLYHTETNLIKKCEVGNAWLGEFFEKSSSSKIKEMQDYLITTYILASVDELIAPLVGGTIGALRIKGKYNHLCIYSREGFENIY